MSIITPETVVAEAPVTAPKKSRKKAVAIVGAILLGLGIAGGGAAVYAANQPITTQTNMAGLDANEETFILAVEDFAQVDLEADAEEGALWFGYGALTLMDMGQTEAEVVASIVEEGASQTEAQTIVDLAQANLVLDEG